MAEMMGKAGGVSGGRGGSQQLHRGSFYSNGVLGSTAPVAAGMALAKKMKGAPTTVALFVGDGTFGEGVIYETLNMAALWQLPLFERLVYFGRGQKRDAILKACRKKESVLA